MRMKADGMSLQHDNDVVEPYMMELMHHQPSATMAPQRAAVSGGFGFAANTERSSSFQSKRKLEDGDLSSKRQYVDRSETSSADSDLPMSE